MAKTPGTGFPTLDLAGTSDMFYNTLSGSGDAFIAKFDNSGVRTWASLYGGNGSDYASCVTVNKSTGEIFVGGNALSTDTTVLVKYASGAYHQALNAGNQDGFLLKLNSSLGRAWGTYYGGSAYDRVNCLALDPNNMLYVTGQLQSTSFTYYTFTNPAPVFDEAYPGGSLDNSYISAFDPAQKNVWASYLGGSKGDIGYSLVVDNINQLFVVGQTNSDTAATVKFPLNNGMGIPTFYNYWSGATGADNDGTITRYNVKPNFYLGINEQADLSNGLLVYPNPGSNYLNVIVKNDHSLNVKLMVFDILGKEIQSIDLGVQNGDIFHTFDISGLSSGIYFVQAKCGNNLTNKKFIKQ
jgi:hypothetical protein